MNLLFKNAHVVDPTQGWDEVRDIAVKDGILVNVNDLENPEEIDCTGLVLTPGLLDIHVHLRDPGQTHKESIATGTASAAAGGFTTVVAMPNTNPPVDSPEVFKMVNDLAAKDGVIKVIQSACLSKGRAGKEVLDFGPLKEAGVQVLTDDGSCFQDNSLMLKAMEGAKKYNLPVTDHCEDDDLAGNGVMHEGEVSKELGLPGKNYASEDMIVARNIVLAKQSGQPVHIQHISSAYSVELVRQAQSLGIPVTAEVAPHHICLTDEAIREHGPNAKMNPPLRTDVDKLAILNGLTDGTITCIATDHAPHTAEEKGVGMEKAPCGIVGFECAVTLCLTELYHTGHFSLSQFVSFFTKGPREVLNIEAGTLEVGKPADITLIDLDAENTIDIHNFYSKSNNCPYDGMKCKGKPVATIVDGKFVFDIR